VPTISLFPSATLCSNTLFQNFGASAAPDAGTKYTWSATNAFVYAHGSTSQYALVNFETPGTAVVTLSSTSTSTSCTSPAATYAVTVGSGVSDNPEVIYFNGQLICMTSDEDSYQWGYDDAITLQPTQINGEINPNYFVNGLDLVYRYYWVMTKKGDCTQKSYYNKPTGVVTVNNSVDLKVYPNPASNMVNVEVNTAVNGRLQVEILNLMGQKVSAAEMQNHMVKFNVNELPAGCYMVNCLRDGVKIGSTKFIKN
jgi:hypothetical protein